MPKIRIFIIFFLVFFISILVTGLLSYRIASKTQLILEKEVVDPLVSLTNTIADPVYRKTIAHYQAFNERKIIYTAKYISLSTIVGIALLVSLLCITLFFVNRPLSHISKKLSAINWEDSLSYQIIPEEGPEEIRAVIRAYNQAIRRLSDYQSLVGNISRFRGWKEICRAIVHETGNLLSPIRSYAFLISEKKDPKSSELGLSILRNVEDIQTILRRLKELTSLPEANLQPANLVSIAQEVRNEFISDSINIDVSGNPVLLRLDKTLIREVLRNLIKNALEAAEAAIVSVKIDYLPDYTELTVSDRGPGIPAEKQMEIFQVGYSTKPGNLGIGLALVKHIVQEHKAEISLHSSPAEGSVFSIRFREGAWR